MSGHSKWSTIKHKKGAADAKRGALFTKIIKEVTVAAKNGGGNPESNATLRNAIAKAKDANMPADNITRAIKKGTGELPGVVYEEIVYEGYGPSGVAFLIDVLTDNKNRTIAEIRNILEKKGGNMSGAGSVAWQFETKGLITVKRESVSEDKLMSIVLDAGASDFSTETDVYEVTSDPQDLERVKQAIEKAGISKESAEIAKIPSNMVQVNLADAKKILTLSEALEDNDDVQNVYSNADISDEIMQELSK